MQTFDHDYLHIWIYPNEFQWLKTYFVVCNEHHHHNKRWYSVLLRQSFRCVQHDDTKGSLLISNYQQWSPRIICNDHKYPHPGSDQPLGVRQWLQASSQLRTGEHSYTLGIHSEVHFRWCQSYTWLTWWRTWSTQDQRGCRPPTRSVTTLFTPLMRSLLKGLESLKT